MASSTLLPPIDDPHANHAGKIIASTVCGFVIATSAILLRLFCRWLCRKNLEANDYFIFAAYPFKLALDVSSICLIEYGIGQHVVALTTTQITKFLKTQYVGSFVYAPCIGFTKLSILALYWTAFPFPYMRWAASLTGAIVVAWAVACCLVGLLSCLPIRKAWEPTIAGHCIDLLKYYYGLQIPNIVTDVMLLVLPIKAVYDLGLPLKQTVALSSVFCLALVTIAFDIVRLVVLVNVPANADFSWNLVGPSIWTDIEPSIAILVACLPVMRPLLNLRTFWRNRKIARHSEVDAYDIGSIEAGGTDASSKDDHLHMRGYNGSSDSEPREVV